MTAARTIAEHHELSPDDRGFNPLPLFHINAEVVGVLASVSARATLIVDDRFHRTRFWNLVEERGATWINAVPAIIHRLLPLRDGETVPSRVRFIRSASAPLPAALLAEFQRVTGLAVLESYGMTEGASQICANPLRGPRKPGSVGLPVGVSLRIVDAASHECRDHEVGQVTIQGPSIIDHYESPGYDDRFRDGWLLTGDLGYRDEDGYIFLVGRTDDVINRGGEKIMPREIEEVIGQVAGVAGVVVVGESDDVFGQVPVAYLECEGVSTLDDATRGAAVLAQCAHDVVAHFPRGRRPARLHLVAALPRHATGKIQRGIVRAGSLTPLFTEEIA
jgi:acyl-CoA synthetase (AMP-forming)/AMP-acid ligase II